MSAPIVIVVYFLFTERRFRKSVKVKRKKIKCEEKNEMQVQLAYLQDI
jgi:hypothetical protein